MRTARLKATWAAAAVALLLTALSGVAAAGPAEGADTDGPVVIGHRGAAGYRPEHTLASYRLAIDLGADYIEPDVVSTRDGVLVARHDNEISTTTDVERHPEFSDRRTTKVVDGGELTGWFTEDFTYAELRTLRATERIPGLRPDNAAFNGLERVPTLRQVVDLARRRGVGVYPETKHPTYFDGLGLSLEEPLVDTLHRGGYRGPDAPAFIQSFEVGNLRDLDRMTDLPLVQLLGDEGQPYDLAAAGDPRTYADLATPQGLARVAAYADGIGPSKSLVVPVDAAGRLGEPTSLVDDAHDAGLVVHPYTFRNENYYLPEDFRLGDPDHPGYLGATGDAAAEYRLYYRLGVDGVFSDYPDTAVAVRTTLSGG
ncbi:glycerophosphodiester phosphodiesterase [soil metagenome]